MRGQGEGEAPVHFAEQPRYHGRVVGPGKKRSTYQDVLDAPRHMIAQIIDGELSLQPRPARRHARTASRLGYAVGGPFEFDPQGPGGWVIVDEPELHFGDDVLVPDLAGWRTERYPERTDNDAYYAVAPDWACEVLSPSTAGYDRVKKLRVYCRESITHTWLIDPAAQTLEVFRLDGDTYRLVGQHAGDESVRAEPFDAIVLQLDLLWRS